MSRLIGAALLAGLGAVIYPRAGDWAHGVSNLVRNSPHNVQARDAFKSHQVIFADKIRNCEDHLLDEELGIAYLSCDPGRDRWNTVLGLFDDPMWKPGTIWYYEYANQTPQDPGEVHKLEITGWTEAARSKFHPLGIGRKGSSREIFVVNHDPDGPFIEQLKLATDGKSAKHVRTIKHKLLHAPNSVAPISDTELLVTNDHYITPLVNPYLNILETYLMPSLASVVHYDIKTGAAEILARQPYPNGIIPLNGTHLAVASSAQCAVNIYAMDIKSRSLKWTQKIRAPFFVDNLRVDSAGTLLLSGHPQPGPIEEMARNNRKYNLDNDATATDLLPAKDRPRSGSWVAEWDGNAQGELRELLVSHDYDTACAATRDVGRRKGIVSGLYATGIIFYEE